MGWIEAAPGIIQKLEKHPYVRSGGGLVPFQAQIAARLLNSGEQDRHLQMLTKEYKERVSILVKAIKLHPDTFTLHRIPTGGYFVWVEIKGKPSFDASELRHYAVSNFKVRIMVYGDCASITK